MTSLSGTGFLETVVSVGISAFAALVLTRFLARPKTHRVYQYCGSPFAHEAHHHQTGERHSKQGVPVEIWEVWCAGVSEDLGARETG